MKKTFFSLAIFAFFLSLYAEKTNAQASGVKPELFMYRHNGSLGGSPAPAATGDILGTLQWRALTSIGSVMNGATIRSEATNVAPGVLNANLIFRTEGTLGLLDRMIITDEGRVGIGTNTPSILPHDFKLHVVGNTHTTGRFHGRIHFDENATPATGNPNTYIDEAYFEQKSRAALDAAPGSLPINPLFPVGGILTLAPGGGSLDRQLFSGGNDGFWTRSQSVPAALDAWDTWYKFLTSEDINGRENMLARYMPPGPISSTLRDGQVFDNGTNVVIGGIPAFPAPPGVSFVPTDELTVQGDARVEDNLAVEDNATVTGTTTTGTLSVTNNATVSGNMGIGLAPTANRLEVSGNSRFVGNINLVETAPNTNGNLTMDGNLQVDGNGRVDGMLVIGNPPSVPIVPVQHELYVNGSIIAEEVVVKLQGSWPDYVLAENYDLKPLSEVEAFVQKEKHLPGVPSAAEVAENGLNLGEMQKVQMEKIEEIYLHLIALEKRVNMLEAENAALKAELKSSKH